MAKTSSSTRVLRLALLAIALAAGWVFILWNNRFYLTPSVVFAMLGYFAVVMTTYNLWRTGAAAVAVNEEDDGDEAWGRPSGERDELDREKRTLLKAIKEAEFDHGMGKLSKRDADEMIATYRARAIDVIKELERLEAGEAGTVRERIEREVKARLELDGKAAEAKGKKGKKDKKAADKAADKASGLGPQASGSEKKPETKADETENDDKTPEADDDERGSGLKPSEAKLDEDKADAKTDKPTKPDETKTEDAAEPEARSLRPEASAPEAAVSSATAVEPPAKEAAQ